MINAYQKELKEHSSDNAYSYPEEGKQNMFANIGESSKVEAPRKNSTRKESMRETPKGKAKE